MAKPKGKRGSASRRRAKAGGRAASIARTRKQVAPAKKKDATPKRPDLIIEPRTKTEACLALLVRPGGASLEELQQLTGWQAHSVRGFLAGTVKKIPGATLTSEKTEGERRYVLRRAAASPKTPTTGGRS